MLSLLKLSNVGPAPEMEALFAPRLNILTGDNGLGKSFLLDIAWWALTRRWPSQVNPRLPAGLIARPRGVGSARIGFTLGPYDPSVIEIQGSSRFVEQWAEFDQTAPGWERQHDMPQSEAIAIYAMVDGSFAVWDPVRNYSRREDDESGRVPAFVFSPGEVWNGLRDESAATPVPLCNGLIADWAAWQNRNGMPFERLRRVLATLSPSAEERIEAGELARVGLNDPRDIPTLRMPYGEVPIIHASAGMRRIIALAYLLVWSWEEHMRASALLGRKPTNEVVFLVDEIDAHLHPRWQRTVVESVLAAMEFIVPNTGVLPEFPEGRFAEPLNLDTPRAHLQLITTTHSPLVMAAVEPFYDQRIDAWFDLDLVTGDGGNHVELTRRQFVRHGDASSWLTSEAFDLKSPRSQQAEAVLEAAARALSDESFDAARAQELDARLRGVLGDTDPFWMRWRYVAEKKGWLG